MNEGPKHFGTESLGPDLAACNLSHATPKLLSFAWYQNKRIDFQARDIHAHWSASWHILLNARTRQRVQRKDAVHSANTACANLSSEGNDPEKPEPHPQTCRCLHHPQ